jgi:hypothetical protein
MLGGVDVPDEAAGVGEVGRVEVANGVDEADEADEALGAAGGDDAAEAGGAAVSTMPVTPVEMTKRPEARPSVTGRRYGDRMGTLSVEVSAVRR